MFHSSQNAVWLLWTQNWQSRPRRVQVAHVTGEFFCWLSAADSRARRTGISAGAFGDRIRVSRLNAHWSGWELCLSVEPGTLLLITSRCDNTFSDFFTLSYNGSAPIVQLRLRLAKVLQALFFQSILSDALSYFTSKKKFFPCCLGTPCARINNAELLAVLLTFSVH